MKQQRQDQQEPTKSRADMALAAHETSSIESLRNISTTINGMVVKAGMEQVDKDRIERIIREASVGSQHKFRDQKQQENIEKRIADAFQRLEARFRIKLSRPNTPPHQQHEQTTPTSLPPSTPSTAATITTQPRIDSKHSERVPVESLLDILAKRQDKEYQRLEAEAKEKCAQMLKTKENGKVFFHVDMDAFYASVEILDHPEYRGKPIAVGTNAMLSTASYEARKYGVRSALPGFIAKQLCPQLIIVDAHYDRYVQVAEQARAIFRRYDQHFVSWSYDEASLEVTARYNERAAKAAAETTAETELRNNEFKKSPLFQDNYSTLSADELRNVRVLGSIATEIRNAIRSEIGITCSIGSGPNRRMAKLCSDMHKPDGQYILPLNERLVDEFVQNVPIRRIPHIGNVTEKVLNAIGVKTVKDLQRNAALMTTIFRKAQSEFMFEVILNTGETESGESINKRFADQKMKSVSQTFKTTADREQLCSVLRHGADELSLRLQKTMQSGRVIFLNVEAFDYSNVSKQMNIKGKAINAADDLYRYAESIFNLFYPPNKPVPKPIRRITIGLGQLTKSGDTENKTISSIKRFLQPIQNVSTEICSKEPRTGTNKRSFNSPMDVFLNDSKRADNAEPSATNTLKELQKQVDADKCEKLDDEQLDKENGVNAETNLITNASKSPNGINACPFFCRKRPNKTESPNSSESSSFQQNDKDESRGQCSLFDIEENQEKASFGYQSSRKPFDLRHFFRKRPTKESNAQPDNNEAVLLQKRKVNSTQSVNGFQVESLQKDDSILYANHSLQNAFFAKQDKSSDNSNLERYFNRKQNQNSCDEKLNHREQQSDAITEICKVQPNADAKPKDECSGIRKFLVNYTTNPLSQEPPAKRTKSTSSSLKSKTIKSGTSSFKVVDIRCLLK